jgi:hypothetical protein
MREAAEKFFAVIYLIFTITLLIVFDNFFHAKNSSDSTAGTLKSPSPETYAQNE